jgi:hypothetical protein
MIPWLSRARAALLSSSGRAPILTLAALAWGSELPRANVSVPEMFRATRVDELPLLGPRQSRRAALSPLPGSQR